MLINLSNHPKESWSAKQLNSAIKQYKSVVDLPFPAISPYSSSQAVFKKAEQYVAKCKKLLSQSKDKNNAVHIMGELTFTYYLVTLLKSKNIKCVASTTKRIVVESESAKTSIFSFVKFREY